MEAFDDADAGDEPAVAGPFDQDDDGGGALAPPTGEDPGDVGVAAPHEGATGVGLVGVDLAPDAFWACSCSSIEESVLSWGDLEPGAGGAAATGLMWTAPTGEVAVVDGLDCNGDGIVDLCALDANGDGVADTWLQDTTGVPSEVTGACFADTMYFDATDEGLANCVAVDPQGTGQFTEPALVPLDAPVPATDPAPAAADPAGVPADPAAATPAPASAPAPAPAAPAAPAPAVVPSTGNPLIDIMARTDDPQIQAQISRIMDLQDRAVSAWTH